MSQPLTSPPPTPAELSHLKPRDSTGIAFTAAAVLTTGVGFRLAFEPRLVWWLTGQLLLAAALVEWFVLLHECGHRTLFRSRWANGAVGHVAGVFAMIPFPVWKRIHGRHHKWTGWQDLDPTTAALAPRQRTSWERALVNFCWRYWIPLFSLLYRLANFWNLPRLLRLFPDRRAGIHIVLGVSSVALVYGAAIAAIGPWALVRALGPALLAAFIAEDILILSQHTHIPMGQSLGQPVTPHAAHDQERFTRSLRLPAWLSRLVLHFDAHELHHMYPFVPGYCLQHIEYETQNEVGWWRWTSAARAIPAEVLLFQNRDETGFDL